MKRKSISYISTTEGFTLITYYTSKSIEDVKYFLIPNKYIDDRERVVFESASQFEATTNDPTILDLHMQASVSGEFFKK